MTDRPAHTPRDKHEQTPTTAVTDWFVEWNPRILRGVWLVVSTHAIAC